MNKHRNNWIELSKQLLPWRYRWHLVVSLPPVWGADRCAIHWLFVTEELPRQQANWVRGVIVGLEEAARRRLTGLAAVQRPSGSWSDPVQLSNPCLRLMRLSEPGKQNFSVHVHVSMVALHSLDIDWRMKIVNMDSSAPAVLFWWVDAVEFVGVNFRGTKSPSKTSTIGIRKNMDCPLLTSIFLTSNMVNYWANRYY